MRFAGTSPSPRRALPNDRSVDQWIIGSFISAARAKMTAPRFRIGAGMGAEGDGWMVSISEIFGHSSFLLLALSFAMEDLLSLRATALFAGASMAGMSQTRGEGSHSDLVTPVNGRE